MTDFFFVADEGILTAYFAYHLYLRVELLTLHTVPHMLQTIGPDIRSSMACVERAVSRLGMLKSGSEARVLWSTMRQKIIKYVETGNRHNDRLEIGADFDQLGGLVVNELTQRVSWRLLQLWYHVQNLQAVIGATLLGDSLPPEAADTYLRITDNMGRDCMSEEYFSVLDGVREKMQFAILRPLTDDEVAFIHLKSVWQSDHFLRHFRSESFSPSIQSPWQALRSLDSGLGIEAAEMLRAIRDSEMAQKQLNAERLTAAVEDVTLGDRPASQSCDGRMDNQSDGQPICESPAISPERSAYGEATAEEVLSSTLSDPVTSRQQREDASRSLSPVVHPCDPSDTADFSTQKLESINNLQKLDDCFQMVTSVSEARSFQSQLNACVAYQNKAVNTLQQEQIDLSSTLELVEEEVIRFSLRSALEEKDEDILWVESHLRRLKRLQRRAEERINKLQHQSFRYLPLDTVSSHLSWILSEMKHNASLLCVVVVGILDFLDTDELIQLSDALHIAIAGENIREEVRNGLQKWL